MIELPGFYMLFGLAALGFSFLVFMFQFFSESLSHRCDYLAVSYFLCHDCTCLFLVL